MMFLGSVLGISDHIKSNTIRPQLEVDIIETTMIYEDGFVVLTGWRRKG